MRLKKRLRLLAQKREALLREVVPLQPDQLTARPLQGKWSILEIFEHLVIAEREVLGGLPEPFQLVRRRRLLKHHLAYPLVMLVLKFSIPVKVPSSTMVPRGRYSFDELRLLWNETMEWVQKYAESIDSTGTRDAVFEHPVAGPLTIGQALHMDQLHLESHTHQIRECLALIGKP